MEATKNEIRWLSEWKPMQKRNCPNKDILCWCLGSGVHSLPPFVSGILAAILRLAYYMSQWTAAAVKYQWKKTFRNVSFFSMKKGTEMQIMAAPLN